jgi:hypothetical protein
MKLIISLSLAATATAFAPQSAFMRKTSLDANIADTLATLEGPGQVWGAEGIEVGKEESDLRGYDGFALFTARLASSGVADTLKGPGPFTLFAPTDSAIQAYEEKIKGTIGAAECNYCIVPGTVPSSGLASSDLKTAQGESLTYCRQFRKDFVNDAIVGEKTFGRFSDFPVDLACDNGLIHAVSIMLAPGYAAAGAEAGLGGQAN